MFKGSIACGVQKIKFQMFARVSGLETTLQTFQTINLINLINPLNPINPINP